MRDAGGVGSDGVTKRSGFTARHVLAKVSWLKLARTLATRNSAVELLFGTVVVALVSSPGSLGF